MNGLFIIYLPQFSDSSLLINVTGRPGRHVAILFVPSPTMVVQRVQHVVICPSFSGSSLLIHVTVRMRNHFVCSQPDYGCPASPACCSSVYGRPTILACCSWRERVPSLWLLWKELVELLKYCITLVVITVIAIVLHDLVALIWSIMCVFYLCQFK